MTHTSQIFQLADSHEKDQADATEFAAPSETKQVFLRLKNTTTNTSLSIPVVGVFLNSDAMSHVNAVVFKTRDSEPDMGHA